MAARDEQADTSRSGPSPARETKTVAIPDYLVHAELVVNGNMTGRKKGRPTG